MAPPPVRAFASPTVHLRCWLDSQKSALTDELTRHSRFQGTSGGSPMTDRTYLKRRAAQETELASSAMNRRVAAAHDVMAAAYFRQLAALADSEERRPRRQRPPQFSREPEPNRRGLKLRFTCRSRIADHDHRYVRTRLQDPMSAHVSHWRNSGARPIAAAEVSDFALANFVAAYHANSPGLTRGI